MQRQQSQAQMETLTNRGAAQVAKTTHDARDFQTKAFSKMKGFKGDEKAWPGWRYKFRVEASGVSVKQLRSWIELRTETMSRFLSRTSNKLLRGRIGLTWQILTCSFTVICNLFETYSYWRGCSRRRKLAIQMWLQAWRDSSKSCEWFARDLAIMCRTSGNRSGVHPENLSEDPP